jgi:type VI secretion system secreted protein Hcp
MLAVGLAGGGAAVAVATVPGSNGVINACYAVSGSPAGGTIEQVPVTTGANLRIIDKDAGQACNTLAGMGTLERPISWNVAGRRGPPGRTGAKGPPGTATFTYTLVPPLVRVTAPPDGGVVLGTGRDAIKFQFLSFNFSVKGSGHGGGTGQSTPGTITVTKAQDKSSPRLFKLALQGKSFKQATITLVKKTGGKQPYLVITLNNTLVSSFQTGSSKAGQRPEETLTLSYSKTSEKFSK